MDRRRRMVSLSYPRQLSHIPTTRTTVATGRKEAGPEETGQHVTEWVSWRLGRSRSHEGRIARREISVTSGSRRTDSGTQEDQDGLVVE
jgi:hypothetical protein